MTEASRAVGPLRRRRAIRAAALIASLGALSLTGCTATSPAAAPTPTLARAAASPAPAPDAAGNVAVTPAMLLGAARARHDEDHGEYAAALGEWRRLRPQLPADGDLELATAIDEARSGQLDSAATRLSGALLSAAALDTLPAMRYRFYPATREGWYLNGSFDGWHWYIWRARAEVAAARGLWEESTIAARRCVAARPMSGKEWLLLAICAGRAGRADEARAAASQAVTLDRGVPEAHYLKALWAWKDGRRGEAQVGFRSAVAVDSTFRPAAVALVRLRLPGTTPDSLPTEVLTGPREVGMLTSRVGPKLDEYVKSERSPILAKVVGPHVPDSLQSQMLARSLKLWLFVDPEGRVVLHDLPWYPPGTLPSPVVSELVALLPLWRFRPETVQGNLRGIWVDLSHTFSR